ncbi:hypothetical protein BHE74_00018334 [Ensete ventricosum]|nr:hypothetical protein GW17_00014441 [Ensete ventricosum]RWW73754.1 hypothetical protein BHE74_00018334 [Ensete ventricosum]RZR76976.1 hypothetical protein BHM03_00001903 [Ensete ventricosum]
MTLYKLPLNGQERTYFILSRLHSCLPPRSSWLSLVPLMSLFPDQVEMFSSSSFSTSLSFTSSSSGPSPSIVYSSSGSPEVEVLSSSSRDMSPMDAKAFKALGVMRLCHDYDSVMTNELLVKVRKRYNISNEYALHAPFARQRPYDSLSNRFGFSIDALEAGLRFSSTT